MKNHHWILLVLLLLGLAPFLLPKEETRAMDASRELRSPTTPGYALDWWTVDGGGGDVSAAPYRLEGTIGQPDAAEVSQGSYTLVGGYWGGGVPAKFRVYLPVVLR